MSTVIQRVERQNLEANLKRMREEKAREAQNLNQKHNKNMEKQKEIHHKELNDIRSEHDAVRLEELKAKEVKLSKLRQSVEKVKEATQSQIDTIKLTHQEKKEMLKQKHQTEMVDLDKRYTEDLDEFKDSKKYKVEQIKRDQINQTKTAEKDRYLAGVKITQKNEQFINETSDKANSEVEKVRFEKKMLLNDEKNIRHMAISTEREKFNKDFKALQKMHTNKLLDEKIRQNKEFGVIQKRFESRYNKQIEEHRELSQKLDDNKKVMVDNLKKEVIEDHEKNINLNKDDFYHYRKLDHHLTKNENGYVLEMPVSERNREFLSVNPYDKKIKISFNRSFNEKRVEDDSTNKVTKIETFHKTIPLDRPVNNKKVESTYNDGILKFNIPFA